MGVTELIKAITEFGIIPVALAVILFVVLLMFKRMSSAMQSQEERLTALTELNLKTSSKVHTKSEEDDNRKVNNFITEQLHLILKESHANRVYCVAYHNGGSFINARNFTKCSIIAEAVDYKTKSIAKDYQNVQRALLIELDNALAEKGECYLNVNDIHEIKTKAPGCYQLLKAIGSNAWYAKALADTTTGVILGFIVADFTDTEQLQSPENIYQIQLNLSKKAQRISGALQMNALNHEEDK